MTEGKDDDWNFRRYRCVGARRNRVPTVPPSNGEDEALFRATPVLAFGAAGLVIACCAGIAMCVAGVM